MKKYSVLFLLVIGILSTGTLYMGCKKGQDDPFFSFRSRKARVAGEYDITSKNVSYITKLSSGMRIQTDVVISGTSQKTTIKWLGLASALGSGDSTYVENATILQNWINFDKKGPFKGVYEYRVVQSFLREDSGYTRKVTYTHKEEFIGSWDFLSGVDNYKKKERIALIYEDMTETDTRTTIFTFEDLPPSSPTTSQKVVQHKYANGERGEILHIRELRSKKMVFDAKINQLTIGVDTTIFGQSGSSWSVDGTMIETLEEKSEK